MARASNKETVDKTLLVLLPGLLCDAALFAPQAAALSDVCDAWIPDLTRDDSMQALAARVLAEAPAQRFALAGLSMGGYVALEIMRQAPQRVQRLALLDTRARPDSADELERRRTLMRIAEGAKGFAPINKRMLPLLVHPARLHDDALVRTIQDMAERTGIAGYLRQQNAIISRADFRPHLGRIACPTLVLCGRQDAITLVGFHEEIVAGIPGARLVIVEDCGHLSTLEQPQRVTAALREWLAGA
ncbi:MAG TPA: alpha/beta fold hydrolase [Burkholderiales bacterium]|nr:alpha/beta fold hydrolase [Burkholderiales bacterium]